MSEYFRSDKRFIYLEKPYCEFYIPMKYFDGVAGFATDFGSTIKTMGVFDVGFFENDQLKEMRVLNLPSWITVYVNDFEISNIKLPGEDQEVQCKVLKFYKGNKVMNATIVEDSENAEMYLKFITNGKVPSSVPYNQSLRLWRKNQVLNGVHLGVPSVIEELILSATYRDKNDQTKKFATVIGADPKHVSQFDYKMVSARQICQFTSTFTAVTFEDIDSMITSSINRARNKTEEKPSPIEKIIKM